MESKQHSSDHRWSFETYIHQTQHLIVKQIMHGDIYLSEVTITNIYHRSSGQPRVDLDSDMCYIMLFFKKPTEL
jgi:hypothetical protein